MTPAKLGNDSSMPVEVLSISQRGVWILVRDREFFLGYDQFPWFRDARISDVLEIELQGHAHLHWPRLDVDLDFDRMENPDRYPLVSV